MYNPSAGPSAMPTPSGGPLAPNIIKEEQLSISDTTLAAISVSSKLPEFWVEMPRLWFAQFEAVMAPQKQGDTEKFNMVISKLGRAAIQQVSDLVTSPPASEKYITLKGRLLQVYEESAERQFQRLVSGVELGAQKPSQLLRCMRDLGRTTEVSEQTLKNFWLARMNPTVKAVIAVCPDQSIENLAAMADKIVECSESSEIAVVTTSPGTAAQGVTELANQLHKLTMEVASLRSEVFRRGRSRSGGRQNFRSRSHSHRRKGPEDPGWLCKFHYRYRKNAKTCEKPCAWRTKDSEN